MKQEIPAETLRTILQFEPETGKLFWRDRARTFFDTDRAWKMWNTRYAGREALAAVSRSGHLFGTVFHSPYLAHRVVFAIVHGRWPVGQVDHADGNPANNRPDNLREATHQENKRNQGPQRNGSSRFRGVSWSKRVGKWRATANDDKGKHRSLGYFVDEVEAAKARDQAVIRWHGDFARLNLPEVPV